MKLLIVLSGGMDSTVALYWAMAIHEVVGCVSFDYGSKHNDMEYAYAEATCTILKIKSMRVKLDFSFFESDLLKSGGDIPDGHYADPSMKRTVVPFRNGIMLSYSAGIAESMGAQGIVIGNHFGDHTIYPDCRKEFILPMHMAIKTGTYAKIELLSPFCDIDKTEVCRKGEILGVDWANTYSCYNGKRLHCGKCGTCTERIEAFKNADVFDPTEYEVA